MHKYLAIALAAIVLTGCAGLTKPEPQVKVIYVTKKEVVQVSEAVLAKCLRPAPIKEQLPGLGQRKVSETELTQAFIASYSNEVNCYGVRVEVERLQRETAKIPQEPTASK